MGAKSVSDIGIHQAHEFIQSLEKAGLTSEIAQQVIVSKDNKKALAMMAALGGIILQDDRFQLATTLEIVVPEDYVHATRLATFKKAHGKEFYYYNDAIADENYAGATDCIPI